VIIEDPYHPETMARSLAHGRRRRGSCASDLAPNVEGCDCEADPEELELIWTGKARMANARLVGGVDLNDIDREALRRAGIDLGES
jgi:hypothetical protein